MSEFGNLVDKFERMGALPDEVLFSSVAKQITGVADAAKMLCPGHTGELRQSIKTRTEWIEGGVRATCYTNKKYAPYVEFGTGPNGEENHAGISPAVNVAYSQQGWIIPASAMSVEEAEAYGFGIAEKDGKVIGYYTNGQQARPFMYPALKNNERQIVRALSSDFGKKVRTI